MAAMPDMTVSLSDVQLRNPLITAAGTCGYGAELSDVFDVSRLGAVTTKSITAQPRGGNDPMRMVGLPAGLLNAVGLANVGLDRFLQDKMPAAAAMQTVVIGSIAGHSIDEYVDVAAAFDAIPELPLVELNVSCPNTGDGLQFGASPAALRPLLDAVRPVLKRTRLIVKLSPNVGDLRPLAELAIEAGADALTLINTMTGLAIDPGTRRSRLAAGCGGLSGAAIHPIAVRMVHEVWHDVARAAGIPIIGLGGVSTWRDAAELVLAGASAIGMGTTLFVNPRRPGKVLRGLERWVTQQGCASITELVGAYDVPGG